MKRNSSGLYLLIFSLTAVLGVTVAQDCSESRINSCLQAFSGSPVLIYANRPIDADLPNWNETFDMLKDRCRRFTLYSQCMSTVIPFCNSSYQDSLNGLDDGYTYLCQSDDDLLKLVNYQMCYEKSSVTQVTNSFCVNTYANKLGTLKFIDSPEEQRKTFCSVTDVYLSCLTTTVKDFCTPDASSWQQQWNIKKRYQQMAVTLQCSGWYKSSNDAATVWTIVLATVLGLTTLIMIIGIIIILVFIKRKKKSHRRAGIPPPPPYTYGNYDDGPAPVISVDTTEPSVTFPAGSSTTHSGDDATGANSVAINMRPTNKLPVKPPPYADQNAPAYESPSGASNSVPNAQGEVNHGFQKTEGGKQEEEEEEDIPPGPSEPGPTAGNVSDSERELNSNWF